MASFPKDWIPFETNYRAVRFVEPPVTSGSHLLVQIDLATGTYAVLPRVDEVGSADDGDARRLARQGELERRVLGAVEVCTGVSTEWVADVAEGVRRGRIPREYTGGDAEDDDDDEYDDEEDEEETELGTNVDDDDDDEYDDDYENEDEGLDEDEIAEAFLQFQNDPLAVPQKPLKERRPLMASSIEQHTKTRHGADGRSEMASATRSMRDGAPETRRYNAGLTSSSSGISPLPLDAFATPEHYLQYIQQSGGRPGKRAKPPAGPAWGGEGGAPPTLRSIFAERSWSNAADFVAMVASRRVDLGAEGYSGLLVPPDAKGGDGAKAQRKAETLARRERERWLREWWRVAQEESGAGGAESASNYSRGSTANESSSKRRKAS